MAQCTIVFSCLDIWLYFTLTQCDLIPLKYFLYLRSSIFLSRGNVNCRNRLKSLMQSYSFLSQSLRRNTFNAVAKKFSSNKTCLILRNRNRFLQTICPDAVNAKQIVHTTFCELISKMPTYKIFLWTHCEISEESVRIDVIVTFWREKGRELKLPILNR